MKRSILLLLPLVPWLMGTTYYCDPVGGNNSNDGLSAEAAWGSLSSCFADKVKRWPYLATEDWVNPAAPVGPGDTIVLMEGWHGTLELSGYRFAAADLTLQAAEGATAILGETELTAIAGWHFDGIVFDYWHTRETLPISVNDKVFWIKDPGDPWVASANNTIENCTFRACDNTVFATLSCVDEIQTLTPNMAASAGTFTLTVADETTANIAYDATVTEIESAIAALGGGDSLWSETEVSSNSNTPVSAGEAFVLTIHYYGDVDATVMDVGSLTGPTEVNNTETQKGVNTIHDQFYKLAGLYVSSADSEISSNTIYNVDLGIVAGGDNLVVSGNTVDKFVQNGSNILAGDNQVWEGNTIQNRLWVTTDHPDLIQLNAMEPSPYNVTIRNNKLYCYTALDYHPNTGTSQGIFIEGSQTDTNHWNIYNNLILADAYWGIYFKFPCSDCNVVNNTCLRVPDYITARTPKIHCASTATNVTFRNNICVAIDSDGEHGTQYVDHNYNVAAIDYNDVFVDPTGRDFHLKEGSAAISSGLATLAPVTDLDGETRGDPPDIGAYEYVASSVDTPPQNHRYGFSRGMLSGLNGM